MFRGLHFNLAQLLLLTALVALLIALASEVYRNSQTSLEPESVTYATDGSATAVRFTDGTVRVWDARGRLLNSFDTRSSQALLL